MKAEHKEKLDAVVREKETLMVGGGGKLARGLLLLLPPACLWGGATLPCLWACIAALSSAGPSLAFCGWLLLPVSPVPWQPCCNTGNIMPRFGRCAGQAV